MKKLFKTIICLVSLLILTACFSKEPPSLEERVSETQNEIQTEKTYTGTIESFGVDIYQDGTHKIVTDDNKTVIIQSPTINLNNYLGKKVIITGSMQKLIDNESEVFTVDKIELVGASEMNETTEYKNQSFGFQLKYPNSWVLAETAKAISFKDADTEVAKIDIFSNIDSNLDDYVKSKEAEDGTPVTIGGQRSLRYTDANEIRIYTPNTSKKKVYKITFLKSGENTESSTQLFYGMLESFTVLESKTETGDKCGGKDNIACKEGYFCELQSDDIDAEGICVSIDKNKTNPDCPFIPVPQGCTNYEAKSFNKDGCPTSYACLDTPADESASLDNNPDEITTDETIGLIDTKPILPTVPNSYDLENKVATAFQDVQAKLLPENADLLTIEVVPDQDLLVAIYTVDSSKYRTVFEYSSSVNGYDFTKKASYVPGETRDWVLKDGEDIKIVSDKMVLNVGNNSGFTTVFKGFRLYENTYKNFSLQYPSSWYYRSFGPIEDSVWTVGFGDKAVDSISDAIVKVSIVNGSSGGKSEIKDDKYNIEVERDSSTHFVLESPTSMKDTIDKMAGTIAQR